jgi:hypothetical protein
MGFRTDRLVHLFYSKPEEEQMQANLYLELVAGQLQG